MLYLASQSPRRKTLLAQLGLAFEVLPALPGMDMEALEVARPNEAPKAYVQRVALAKLHACLPRIAAQDAVLVADTTVALGRQILGKPESASANAAMLSLLQGQTHRVMTAVAVHAKGHTFQTICTSWVRFAPLTSVQIDAYAAGGEGWDKAGGYAVQGQAAAFVAHMRGNYTGVVGLPLYETQQLLVQAGLL